MPAVIKFGTSGWRAVMAEDFTFASVRRAITGIARYVYHGTAVGGNSPMNNMRFGEKADWYIKPVLKRAPHR